MGASEILGHLATGRAVSCRGCIFSDSGECRRNPPSLVQSATRVSMFGSDTADNIYETMWPEARSWCGEWHPNHSEMAAARLEERLRNRLVARISQGAREISGDELSDWGPQGVDDRPLWLWEVRVGEAPNWVAARDAVEAMRVAGESECLSRAECEDSLSVRLVGDAEASELTFFADDESTCSMLEEFRRRRAPGHIASPDW